MISKDVKSSFMNMACMPAGVAGGDGFKSD